MEKTEQRRDHKTRLNLGTPCPGGSSKAGITTELNILHGAGGCDNVHIWDRVAGSILGLPFL